MSRSSGFMYNIEFLLLFPLLIAFFIVYANLIPFSITAAAIGGVCNGNGSYFAIIYIALLVFLH